MRLGLAAALLTLVCLLPLAAAQVPDPEDVVLLACDTAAGVEPQARDLLPVCPREEPAAPAPAGEDAAAPAPPAPAAPGDEVEQLADGILDEVQEIPNDPTSAPAHLLAIVDAVVTFVKDLLGIPAAVGDAVQTRFAEIDAALEDAQQRIADASAGAKGAVASAIEKVVALFDRAPAQPADAPKLPTRAPVEAPSIDLPIRLRLGLA